MPRKRQLPPRREDTDPRMPPGNRRKDEHRLREIHLPGEQREKRLGHRARIGKDRELVPGERLVSEDVADDIAKIHRPPFYATRREWICRFRAPALPAQPVRPGGGMGGGRRGPLPCPQCDRESSKPCELLIRSSVPGMYFFSSSWKYETRAIT